MACCAVRKWLWRLGASRARQVSTKKAIRRPYPLPQERFHYRGEDALSCVRSVVGRRVLDGEHRVSDPCISSTRLMSAGARCDFIRIIFNKYMHCIIFSRSARFVLFFFRRGTEGNFGGDRAELCPSHFAVEPEVQSIIENFNWRTSILFYSIGLYLKENGYREARGCYDAGEWTREWFHKGRWNGWRSSFVKHWNQLVQENSQLCEEVNS